MKMKNYFMWMIAATLAMGCSDDIGTGGGNDTTIEGETGYISIALNLPSTSGTTTRAQNGNFDDGIAAEYKVNNVMLLIFQGATEASATFKAAVDGGSLIEDDVLNNKNITSYIRLNPVEIPKPTGNDNTYALAIINTNSLFTIGSNGTLTWGGNTWTSSSNNTVKDLYTTILKNGSSQNVSAADISSSDDGKGFLMTNAPYASHPSVGKDDTWPTNFTVTTLPEIHVYDTESQAEGQEPDDIYVERVVAKVTVTVDSNDGSITVGGEYYKGDNVTIEGWNLQITNKSTYFVRNVSSWNDWQTLYTNVTYNSANTKMNRFFGTGSEGRPYRVYWAIDPNYDKTYSEDNPNSTDFNILTTDDSNWKGIANGRDESSTSNIAYCLENTFGVAQMEQNQTTGIVFKARYTPKGAQEGDHFFIMGGTSRIYTMTDFLAKLNDILGLSDENKLTQNNINPEAVDGGTYTSDNENGKNITDLIVGLDESMKTKLKSDPEVKGEIKFYKEGVVFYYSTQIQHFGDYYTPIDDQGSNYVESTEDYNDYYHLGRYGVVRNNWYEINVTAVDGPGEPEIPEEPEEPDDPKEAWVKARINILSWAVRSQDVTLR